MDTNLHVKSVVTLAVPWMYKPAWPRIRGQVAVGMSTEKQRIFKGQPREDSDPDVRCAAQLLSVKGAEVARKDSQLVRSLQWVWLCQGLSSARSASQLGAFQELLAAFGESPWQDSPAEKLKLAVLGQDL